MQLLLKTSVRNDAENGHSNMWLSWAEFKLLLHSLIPNLHWQDITKSVEKRGNRLGLNFSLFPMCTLLPNAHWKH